MAVTNLKRKSAPESGLPHSWAVNEWPETVFPGSTGKARYMIRVHKMDLLQAGALVRVGRGLVVLGARYARWLELQAGCVPGYECGVASSKKSQA